MPLSQCDLAETDDPLASWNDGPTKKSIVDFVARVTKAGGIDYVAPEERIATFDNDGTLWSDSPTMFSSPLPSIGWRQWRPSTRSGKAKSHSSRFWLAT